MLPVIQNETNTMPSLVGADQFAAEFFAEAFGGFASTYRYLRPKKLDFQIASGGNVQSVPNGEVIGVLLGVAPYNHCTWYEKKFQVGQEPERPDLLWVQKDANTFPDALPAQYRQKQMVGGVARWDFRIARRTVWALVTRQPNGQFMLDVDNPVIFDMTSASMFGKSDFATNSYKWAGLKQFCDQHSTGGVKCLPCMFYMQIAIDPNSPVPGVVVFRPMVNNGVVSFLDNDTYAAVVEKAQSGLVKDMLTVQEILEREKREAAPAAPAAPVAQPVPPVQTATAPAQPAPSMEPVDESLLAQAQSIIKQRQQAPAPEQPATARPKVSAAAAEGVANLMGSLGDF